MADIPWADIPWAVWALVGCAWAAFTAGAILQTRAEIRVLRELKDGQAARAG